MTHRCKDGQATKLERHGAIGFLEGVTFRCPRCGYVKSAIAIERDSIKALDEYVASVK